jgi:maltooligosyltrehalose trehalohydrolase
MHAFRVWAPVPRKVELQYDGGRFPMKPAGDGWWSAEITAAKPGDDYGFVLDGDGPFPDPQSACQPNGIHKLSRLVDQKTFAWTDQCWQSQPLSSAIIYELHIGTFTGAGTFNAAIEKLDYLVQLGITHVELMPVVEFSGDHGWGYDGVDLFAPHHAYGKPDDLKNFVNACHVRCLGVILDVVYNHLGPSGNYWGKFAPYFTQRYAPSWGEALNYDGPDSEPVRRFFCDNALMWLRDFHFDGLRLDAVHAIYDFSAQHFLEQLKLEVEHLAAQLGRHLFLIPESDLNDPRLLWPKERGGFNLDAQWSDDFHHALHSILTGEKNGYYSDFGTLEDLARALSHAYVYDGKFSPHRRRRHGRPAEGLSGHRFLGYLQNHDQIGNRARGERTSQLLSRGRLKIGAAIVLTSPFVPMLFQGEEWGASTPFLYFTDHQDPELGKAVDEGRCREFAAFNWDPATIPHPQDRGTFEKSKLNWTELAQQPHKELLEWHRQLIRLRHAEPALTDEKLDAVQSRFDETAGWFVTERHEISVACNLSRELQHVPLRAGKHQILAASEPGVTTGEGSLFLPPESVAIVKLMNDKLSVAK